MILLVYPKYVGGKFISNCLALSKHCVVQEKTLAEKDLSFTSTDENYYQFKLRAILKSLPSSKSLVRQWARYEFGCAELYGIDEEFYREKSIAEIKQHIGSSEIFEKLKDRNPCIVTHDYQTLLKYTYVFKDAQIIEFENFDKFRRLAALKKDPNPKHVGDDDYVTGENFYYNMKNFYQFDSFTIDVDRTFFDWEEFNQMMRSLYEYLKFDDYQEDLIKQFYEAYIALHK